MSCTIIPPSILEQDKQSSMYRLRSNITDVHPCPDKYFAAYYATSDNYNLTKAEAEEAQRKVDAAQTKCWVRYLKDAGDSCPKNPESYMRLSVLPLTYSQFVAWGATCIAAISAVLMLTAICHFFHNALMGSLDIARFADAPGQPEAAASLSAAQVKVVCDEYSERVKLRLLPDWVCSICLDDDSQQHSSISFVVNTVRLPCSHRFHDRYVITFLLGEF